MLLVRRASLDVSRFFHESTGREPFEEERGLVVRLRVRFAEWLPGELEAGAFVDPGADGTMLSHRWALSCRREIAVKRALIVEPHPLLDVEGNIVETVSVAIGESGGDRSRCSDYLRSRSCKLSVARSPRRLRGAYAR